MNDQPKSPATAISQRNQLIESNLDLVAKIARNIAMRLPPSFAFEDLRSCGYIGLVQAADRWDESRGVPFPYFAARRIRGEILENVRRRHWVANTMHEITPNILEMPGAGVASIEEPADNHAKRKLLGQAIEALNPEERKVFQTYFVHGGQLRGIGQAFGCSQNKSSVMLQQVKKSLRRELEWRGMMAA